MNNNWLKPTWYFEILTLLLIFSKSYFSCFSENLTKVELLRWLLVALPCGIMFDNLSVEFKQCIQIIRCFIIFYL